MVTITNVQARSILDSKGTPTVETTLVLSDNTSVTTSIPSGNSVGKFEAHELRDNDPKHADGKGVNTAVSNVIDIIGPEILGKDPTKQEELDNLLKELDGTPNKEHLGANAMLSASVAIAKAGAHASGVPLYKHIGTLSQITPQLPHLLSNVINGGLHAGKNLDIQEFLLIPETAPSVSVALNQLTHINSLLKKEIVKRGFQPLIGDEGGFAPKLETNEEALRLLKLVTEQAGFSLGQEMFFGMDAASNSFYQNDKYTLKDSDHPLSGKELGDYFLRLAQTYHLKYLEDPFSEDDTSSWEEFSKISPSTLFTVGDDLTVTNPEKLDEALGRGIIKGIIIKPNQIGTLTEALTVVTKAKKANLLITVSHRSGETNDDFIADIAVGVAADLAKFGAPVRGERVAKYNRLLQIESELTRS